MRQYRNIKLSSGLLFFAGARLATAITLEHGLHAYRTDLPVPQTQFYKVCIPKDGHNVRLIYSEELDIKCGPEFADVAVKPVFSKDASHNWLPEDSKPVEAIMRRMQLYEEDTDDNKHGQPTRRSIIVDDKTIDKKTVYELSASGYTIEFKDVNANANVNANAHWHANANPHADEDEDGNEDGNEDINEDGNEDGNENGNPNGNANANDARRRLVVPVQLESTVAEFEPNPWGERSRWKVQAVTEAQIKYNEARVPKFPRMQELIFNSNADFGRALDREMDNPKVDFVLDSITMADHNLGAYKGKGGKLSKDSGDRFALVACKTQQKSAHGRTEILELYLQRPGVSATACFPIQLTGSRNLVHHMMDIKIEKLAINFISPEAVYENTPPYGNKSPYEFIDKGPARTGNLKKIEYAVVKKDHPEQVCLKLNGEVLYYSNVNYISDLDFDEDGMKDSPELYLPNGKHGENLSPWVEFRE